MPVMHPASLYAATARPPVATPLLKGSGRADVVIVGGGYTGLSTALHLAEIGIQAIVLEAYEPGWGASGRNGGQVNPGLYPSPETILADFGEEMGKRMLEFSSSAPDRVFDLVRRHDIACEAVQSGTLRAAFNEKSLTPLEKLLSSVKHHGSPACWVDGDKLVHATGTNRYLAAIRFPQGGKLNPLSYARGLAAAAIAKGATVYGETRALQVEKQPWGWRVSTPGGHIDAKHLVLATNGYTDRLWPGLADTIVPVYSTIAATAPLSRSVADGILRGAGVLYEVGLNTVYYRLDAFGRLLIGGRGVQRDARGLDDARHLIDYAGRLWPRIAGAEWTHVWNGKVAVTTDKHIHLHEPAENVHIALGYNGRGIAMATAMGSLLARRISGEKAGDLPMPVTDMRPVPLRRFAPVGVAFRLTYGRIRDRLGI